jgi:hypothetical protein
MTIVAASDGTPVDVALVTVFFNRREGGVASFAENVSAKSEAAGRDRVVPPTTALFAGGRASADRRARFCAV